MQSRFPTTRRIGCLVLAGLLEGVGAGGAGAATRPGQEASVVEPPTFAATVDVILIDAVVTDEQGRTFSGLTAEDFVVREDGEPQVLTSFEAVDLAAVAATHPPLSTAASRSSTNDAGPPDPFRRVFLVVMDDAGLGLESAVAARKTASQFLSEATRAGDLVSMVVPGAGLMWLARVPEGEARLASIVDSVMGRRAVSSELSGDWEALQVAEARDPLTQERVRVRSDAAGLLPRATRFPGESDESYDERNRGHQEGFLQADARRQLELDRNRRRRLFEAVSQALDAVASVKGRKSVLLLSEGFIREPNDPPFRDLLAALRRSNASIYFLNARQLTSGTAADSRQSGDRSAGTRVVDPQESAGAEVVAEETGGFALHNPADLAAGLARVAQESSSYYLLGYSSTNPKRDGKYRRLTVGLRRPGLKVRARKGYYGPSKDKSAGPQGKRAVDPELERVFSSALPESGIPLRLTAYTLQSVEKAKVRVRLVGEVGLKTLRFEKDGDGSRVATLDVALALNHVAAEGRLRTPWRELKVKVPAREERSEVWVPFEGTFDAPGGASQARLAVRDRTSRALGSVLHDFEVPDPASWRVSTPILSDMPGEELGRPPKMLVGRTFVAGAPLYCYLEVYDGAKARPTSSPPRVSFAYTVVDARGKTRKSQAASPLSLSSAGIPTRLEAIPLSGLPPGAYELRLSVRDEGRGRTQELREPFVVRRPRRPDRVTYLELVDAFLSGEVGRAASGVLEWRAQDLEKLAAALPPEDRTRRRAALQLHTALAIRLWSNARALEAEAQIAIGRVVLARDSPADLHRDWLLALGYYHLAATSPARALPFFEECARLFPDAAEAWLGAGMCYELTSFPDGFAFAALPTQGGARKAERCYRETVRLAPRLAEARLRLGRVLGLTGAFEDAEKELAAAVEASAEGSLTALAQIFRGSLRDARRDLAGAVRHYEAALAADPESQTAAFALSEALHRSGRHRRAALCLVSALTAAPRPVEISPWHSYHLGSGRGSTLLSAHQWAAAPLAVGPEPGEP